MERGFGSQLCHRLTARDPLNVAICEMGCYKCAPPPNHRLIVGAGCGKAVSAVICCRMGLVFPSLSGWVQVPQLPRGGERADKWDLESLLPH